MTRSQKLPERHSRQNPMSPKISGTCRLGIFRLNRVPSTSSKVAALSPSIAKISPFSSRGYDFEIMSSVICEKLLTSQILQVQDPFSRQRTCCARTSNMQGVFSVLRCSRQTCHWRATGALKWAQCLPDLRL